MTEVINKYSISECNRCRVRCQSLLSISLSYILVTPRSLVRCYLAIVSWIRELLAKVVVKVILRLVYSGVTERTISKRVFISLLFSLHFLANCCVIFPRARVFRYVFVLC